jgi:hypothetical protein
MHTKIKVAEGSRTARDGLGTAPVSYEGAPSREHHALERVRVPETGAPKVDCVLRSLP